MAKIYFVRHQADGVAWDFPFAEPPTETQQAAVVRRAFHRWGASHRKTPDQPYWVRVEAVEVLGPGDVPDVPDRVLTGVTVPNTGKADVMELVATGEGRVENPGPGE